MKKLMIAATVLVALAGCETMKEDAGKVFWDDNKSTTSNTIGILLLPLIVCPPTCL